MECRHPGCGQKCTCLYEKVTETNATICVYEKATKTSQAPIAKVEHQIETHRRRRKKKHSKSRPGEYDTREPRVHYPRWYPE